MRVGIDSLRRQGFSLLKGRRVGLLSHQAALTVSGATSAQLLHQALGKRLVALYGPEHGFFGQAGAGEHTYTRKHPDWGIPVYSLYGERRKPSPEMLAGIDAVVCDLQDLGVRCYTYLATLLNMMEACAEAGVEVIVADRPIPLPKTVDGPMLDARHTSFVAPCAVPMVYGMTPAETARWIKSKLGLEVRLSLVPMEGWSRKDAAWDGSRPDWLPPSPGIKTWEAAMTYAATVFTEALPGIDCGRGTNLAFRVFGAPWMNAGGVRALLSGGAWGIGGVKFHPYRYTAGVAPYAGQEIDGVRLAVTNPSRFCPVRTSVAILHALDIVQGDAGTAMWQMLGGDMRVFERHNQHIRIWQDEGARPEWFDKLYGGEQTRSVLQSTRHLPSLFAAWLEDRKPFLRERKRALLYT
ncbi:MAG: DUF1343 domain-containing protein [Kiritimatiellaeota bacterium]|nr:DUF1343 domain-containing protein [Kiritimatiellota bacterium]